MMIWTPSSRHLTLVLSRQQGRLVALHGHDHSVSQLLSLRALLPLVKGCRGRGAMASLPRRSLPSTEFSKEYALISQLGILLKGVSHSLKNEAEGLGVRLSERRRVGERNQVWPFQRRGPEMERLGRMMERDPPRQRVPAPKWGERTLGRTKDCIYSRYLQKREEWKK